LLFWHFVLAYAFLHHDIIEAYKHCKRAYYDTLDLFILTLNDRFVTSLVYVEDLEKRTNIAEKLKKILIKIQAERFKTQARIVYYANNPTGVNIAISIANR
jgi:hypothetical protein